MKWSLIYTLPLLIGVTVGQQRSLNRRGSGFRGNRLIAGRTESEDFTCLQDFGYYSHPNDCSKYYVCVFGGALLESCTGGLMYSDKLQTCDWPRNVHCAAVNQEIRAVNIIDSRTTRRPVSKSRSAKEELEHVLNSFGRGIDNSIRPLTKKSSKLSRKQSNKSRSGRFLTKESNPNQEISSFQAQETSSRSFNIIPSNVNSKLQFTPNIPPIPKSNQLKPSRTSSLNQDPFLSNNNETSDDYYYYYYDYLDNADFLEASTTTAKPRRTSNRKPSQPKKSKPTGGSPQLKGRIPQRLIHPFKKPAPVSLGTSLITDIWRYPPKRPTPKYVQPEVDSVAVRCDPKVCKLPDCYCGQGRVPGGIAPQNVPQLVLLTFDDSVNDLNKKLYRDLFEVGRVNPNGCPIGATFYVSHEWTDYTHVQNLYADGHEIASHSITHSFGEQFPTLKWAKEISGQREIMSAYGGVRMEDIRGMRAPFLAIGGDNMFRMLYEQNFTYDSSMPVYQNKPPSYPYTLDYKIFHDCMIPPCPKNSFPGVWEVPMVMWTDLNGGRCSMVDACSAPGNAKGIYDMLVKNFERHYTTNRAPLGLYFHAAWFTTPHHKEGFIAFLDTISAMDDVWLTTTWQSVQWTRNPVPLSKAKSFKPFQCSYPERPPRCKSTKVCNVWHRGSVKYLKTCQKCPAEYPWTGRTGVQSRLNDI